MSDVDTVEVGPSGPTRPTSRTRPRRRLVQHRMSQGTISEAEFIAKELGLNTRTEVISFAIRQVYRKLKKASK